MNVVSPLVRRWRGAAIGFKFTAIMSFMLLLILLTALTGAIALRTTLGHVESTIISTTDIRELTLEIDRELQHVRQLERAFFLQWPRIGFSQAMELYGVPSQQRIAGVYTLTNRLRAKLEDSPVSQDLRNAIVHLDFYLAAAERYADAFAEAVLLVSELARENTGRQSTLFALGEILVDRLEMLQHKDLLLMVRTAQVQINRYLSTRLQSDMQAALNLLEDLERHVQVVHDLPEVSRSELVNILHAHGFVVEEILELDRRLNEKVREFELRIQALLPISDQLVALARLEVDQARKDIESTRRNANLLLSISVFCAVLMGLFSALLLHRSITHNLAVLSATADQLRGGNLRARAIVPTGDEVGKLAVTFNSMAEQIADLMHDLRQRMEMSQTRLFQGIEAIEEGFALFDKHGRLVTANRNVARMLPSLENVLHSGVAYKELMDVILQAGLIIPSPSDAREGQDDRAEDWRGIHLEMFREGMGIEEVRLANDRILQLRYFRAENGETVVLMGDVTERRQMEEERLEMERRLLHAQKLESLGVLAGGIAHDFNNLLSAMMGNMELALSSVELEGAARQRVEHGLLAARRAADLTRQMLAYSGKGKFDVQFMTLNDLVQDNIHIFQTALGKNIHFVLDLAPKLPLIRADAGQIQQVIMNLITNASEAIGDRSGTMTLSTRHAFCDAACVERSRIMEKPQPGWFVWLEVQDTGTGMSEDVQSRLFDPFFSTKFTGRGLGLSAVLGIVRGHNGTIFLESSPDSGTTFQVLFPVAAGPAVKNRLTEPSPIDLKETKTGNTPFHKPGVILVVDDEEMVRNLSAEALHHLGYKVITASDGLEAVQEVRENAGRIDCVILDLMMPRMDGVTAFMELRKIAPKLPVVLCSGYSSWEVEQRFAGDRPEAFLQKPFTIDALRGLLHDLLQHRDREPR
ncbi:MAG: response regulator [Desulfovibrionales bacterium]|nr:MAG: response regulator [Desulfovibrionales bacterium]